MDEFNNEVVVIIGGSGDIGKQAALLFAQQGAHVILIARGQENLQRAANFVCQEGNHVDVMAADVSDPQEVKRVAAWLEAKFGHVDVLIYGAAIFYLAPAETMDISHARSAMDINYWGAVYITRALLPLVRNSLRKSTVFISSMSVQCTPAFFTAYAAAKHALYGFVLFLRQELRPEAIHVAILSPGPVYTDLIADHIHRDMYRLPFGIPVLKPEPVEAL